MNNKFEFLYATRFWAMVLASASVALLDPAIANQPWYVTFGKFLGLVGADFVAVKSWDRFSDKVGTDENDITN